MDTLTNLFIFNTSINGSLHSDLPIGLQYLASLSGLSGIAALIAILISHFRGPEIVCSAFRFLQLVNSSNGSMICTTLLMSNRGPKSGLVNTMFISLKREQNAQIEIFIPFIDGIIGRNEQVPAASERPVNPFVVESDSTISKTIYFANQQNFRFQKGIYNLDLYALMADKKKAVKLSTRRVELERDLTENEWIGSVDPLGLDEVFKIPQERIIVNWWNLI